jgi:hypothetical protein
LEVLENPRFFEHPGEGRICKSASTKERRCFKPFHKDKGEVVEELSQVQGVCQRCCNFMLQSQEVEQETSRRAREIPLKDVEELGTLEVFKPSKVPEEAYVEFCKECRRCLRTA